MFAPFFYIFNTFQVIPPYTVEDYIMIFPYFQFIYFIRFVYFNAYLLIYLFIENLFLLDFQGVGLIKKK